MTVVEDIIAEEVHDRLIELHTMFDLAWEINKRYEEFKSWQDVAIQDCLKLSRMVTTYIPNIEQTLNYMLESRNNVNDDFTVKFRH